MSIKTYGFSYEWRDNYKGNVNECDIEHVLSAISQGCVEGELITLDENQDEHLGWWKKLKQNKG